MAGAFVSIDINDRTVLQMLDRLRTAGVRFRPVMLEIGEELQERWRERFLTQAGPDGQPWAPLNPDYAAWKRATTGSDLILVLYGFMRDLLSYRASEREVLIGSNQEYAATHQFGAPERGIPARPFLGLSEDDKVEILDIMRDHFERHVRAFERAP